MLIPSMMMSLSTNVCKSDSGEVDDFEYYYVTNCKCYDMYRPLQAFVDNVLKRRNSYMACLAHNANQQKRRRIKHRAVLVVFGSMIDLLIRGPKDFYASMELQGSIMRLGTLETYNIFSTFDSISMHLYSTKNNFIVEIYFYVDNRGVELRYNRGEVKVVCDGREFSNLTDPNTWINMLNKANPYSYVATDKEYIRLFDSMLSCYYDMNDLKNRQYFTYTAIFNRIITSCLSKKYSNNNIREVFEDGNIYNMLSKKSVFNGETTNKNYPQSYSNNIDNGRSNKIAEFLPTVKRTMNDAYKNSEALRFPDDGNGIICPISVKDLKDAGEQNVFADYVIVSESNDSHAVFVYLRNNHHRADGDNVVVLNGYICGVRVRWSFELLLVLKKEFPHLTTQYFEQYVFVTTKACIPLKYHEQYDEFFSPAEITKYKLTFCDAANYSATWKHLDPWARHLNPASKSTVSINNIKGSVANVLSEFQLQCMKYSLGITCYMHIDDTTMQRIFNSALLERNQTPYAQHFAEIEEHGFRVNEQPIISDVDRVKSMNALRRMYDADKLNYRCEKLKHSNEIYTRFYDKQLEPLTRQYVDRLMDPNHKPPSVYNLKVWACFGNYKGHCIEDGIVCDSTFVKQIPPIIYNACIGVSFISKTNKTNFMFVPVREKRQSKDTLIGYVITEDEVSFRHSRHCYILKGVIGNHTYYLIHFKPKSNSTYTNMTIEHVKRNKVLMVLIKGEHHAKLHLGSKIANSFGQKNIISHITDLSKVCYGITRDGRKVHPQLVYSDVSILSRMQAGQFASALRSPDLAIGPNKELIFPIDIVIHTLHPYTNNHPFFTRADTLVNSNGFETQGLAQTNFLLRINKNVRKYALQLIELHGFEIVDAR
ncbi:Lef-8 [Phenacoccus solenopsis nudivirus]|nr:Lef-8 [Phenacoccus solenopsis nudivirus]